MWTIRVTPRHSKTLQIKIVGRETTGTCASNTEFYGIVMMPPEFQKIMDNNLNKSKNTFTSIDDNLIVTIASKEDHVKKNQGILQVLDEAGIRLKQTNCQNRNRLAGK